MMLSTLSRAYFFIYPHHWRLNIGYIICQCMCFTYHAISGKSPPKPNQMSLPYGMLLIEILTHFDAPLHRLTPTSPRAITKGSAKLMRLDLHPDIDVAPPEPQSHRPSPIVPPSSHPIPPFSWASSQSFGSVPPTSTYFSTDDFFTISTPPPSSSSFPTSSFGFDEPTFPDQPTFCLPVCHPLQPLHLLTLILSVTNSLPSTTLSIAFTSLPIIIPNNSINFTSNSTNLSPLTPAKLTCFPIKRTLCPYPQSSRLLVQPLLSPAIT